MRTSVPDWTVTRLAGALGARVDGVRLSRLDAAGYARLDELLAEHLVLALPDQELAPAEHVAVGAHFGEPYLHPFLEPIADHPAILQVLKEATDAETFGGEFWHCDISFRDPPAAVSVLYAHEVPPFGGDTLFANTALAYERLSRPMRTLVDGLHAVHQYPDLAVTAETSATHPIVRIHPLTGRKALFVNAAFVHRIVELEAMESRALLNFLFEHQAQPDLTCRLGWSPGQVAIWDNRATLHYAMNDYSGHRRRLQRVTAMERPFDDK